jgi:hypothetical protein
MRFLLFGVSSGVCAAYVQRMRSFALAVLIALGALIAAILPASATAASRVVVPVVPPSNSGADQYVENVPTAAGNSSSFVVVGNRPGRAGRSSSPAPITPQTQIALARQGRVGRSTATLAQASAPVSASPNVRHRSHASAGSPVGSSGSGGPPGAGASSGGTSGGGTSGGGTSGGGTSGGGTSGSGTSPGGGSPVVSVLRSLTGLGTHGGLGAGLPAALLAATLGLGAIALRRRRAG